LAYVNPIILILEFLDQLLWLYSIVVIAAVVMSWLVQFGVINTYNRFARAIVQFLYSITEPVFAQVRRILPSMGGLDLSPLIVYFVIELIRLSAIPFLASLVLR
jgi:YggT family protein